MKLIKYKLNLLISVNWNSTKKKFNLIYINAISIALIIK